MKRAVYESLGGLDEQFGLGLFDDDDLAEQAHHRDGFELAVAHDLFVHHFGSRTFQGNGIDAERLLKENAAKFAAVWGRKKRRRSGHAAIVDPGEKPPRRRSQKLRFPLHSSYAMKRRTCRRASHPWPGCSMRSSLWIPGRKTERG